MNNIIDILDTIKSTHIDDVYINQELNQLQNNILQLIQLGKDLDKYDEAYYIQNMPIIDDYSYDQFKLQHNTLITNIINHIDVLGNKLPELNRIQALLSIRGVGYNIGSTFNKIQHRYPMLSLDNIFIETEVVNFLNKIYKALGVTNMVCEQKIDGISFSAIYDNGVLIRGVTRGDGVEGEDITQNIKQIDGFPDKVDYQTLFEVRGEIYIDKQSFAQLNELSEKKFANPRNCAAGSLRQLNPKITKDRNLKYFIWQVDFPGLIHNGTINKHSDSLKVCERLGFNISPNLQKVNSKDQIMDYYNNLYNTRSTLNYDIDGVVYKVDSLSDQILLGNTATAPRWAIAHKFPGDIAISTIQDIIFQVSKYGVLTPVAVLEPVNIGGVMISRVTMNNIRDLTLKGYCIGDTIHIVRSGDVIPKIIDVVKKNTSATLLIPAQCPICNSNLIYDDNRVNLLCTAGILCSAQIIEKLSHFVDCLNIMGLGKKQIESLYNAKLLQTYSDIFNLKSDQIAKLDGWGKKSVINILKNIDKCRVVKFSKFLHAISIPHVGLETAELLANSFQSYTVLYDTLISNNAMERLIEIKGIGVKIAESIIKFFTNANNLQQINDLLNHIKLEINNIQFKDENCVFTGTLTSYSRQDAEEIMKKNHCNTAAVISKKTKYLIIGDKPSQAKLEKAKKLNILILTEAEWLKIYKL